MKLDEILERQNSELIDEISTELDIQEEVIDELEKTLDIEKLNLNDCLHSDIDIEKLNIDEEENDDNESKPNENVLEEIFSNNDEEEKSNEIKIPHKDTTIQEAFINCSILGFMVAFIGAGWLINIINHI